MLTHVCVAIQLLGTPAAPDAVQALQQRCEGILGAGECRLAAASAPDGDGDGARAGGNGGDGCWRASVARTADDAADSVVVSAPGAIAGHPAHREVTFQSRDELTERWATLGLVIAALVTLEEHSADASARPGPAAAAPAAETPAGPGRPWFSRDRSLPAPVTIVAGPADPSRAPPRLTDLRLLAVADFGRLPWATFGARLGTTLELVRYLDVEVSGAYLTSTGTGAISVADGGTGGGHFNLWSMALGLCYPQHGTRLSGHTCAGGDVGATSATGFGVAETAHRTVWVPNAWFGFDSMFHLTRHLSLVAEYKVEVAVNRPIFVISSASPIFQASRFSQNVGLGLAAAF
jgi:hypothetical protein